MSDFGETTFHVVRKNHRCEWCGEMILKDEECAHYQGKFEGEWQNWRMHRECYHVAVTCDEMQEGFEPFSHERPEEPTTRPQIQTSGPQCKKCGAFTTYARVESHGLCMKCEIESSPGRVSPGE